MSKKQQIKSYKYPAAVLTDNIRKSPYISYPDGTACAYKYKPKPGLKAFSLHCDLPLYPGLSYLRPSVFPLQPQHSSVRSFGLEYYTINPPQCQDDADTRQHLLSPIPDSTQFPRDRSSSVMNHAFSKQRNTKGEGCGRLHRGYSSLLNTDTHIKVLPRRYIRR